MEICCRYWGVGGLCGGGGMVKVSKKNDELGKGIY